MGKTRYNYQSAKGESHKDDDRQRRGETHLAAYLCVRREGRVLEGQLACFVVVGCLYCEHDGGNERGVAQELPALYVPS